MKDLDSSIQNFNPDGPGVQGKLFGLPFTVENASVVILPIPWEVTVSYNSGTAEAPQSILHASSQVDVFVKSIPDAWKAGITMLPISQSIYDENVRLRELAKKHIAKVEVGMEVDPDDIILTKVNEGCENLNIYIKAETSKFLKQGKLVGLLGGDHSTPLGFIRALSEQYDRFGILQIDAHADLRKSYEGFTYSHASIMYNALKIPAISKLVQVGIRDFCEEEYNVVQRAMGRIKTFYDEEIKSTLFTNGNWSTLCDQIIKELPQQVYISFDIDGLDPKLCPGTGTPVPGGLEFDQVIFLVKKMVKAGKKIIGFDLSEVSSGRTEWDANVGARVLYHLCNWMAVSSGKLSVTAN